MAGGKGTRISSVNSDVPKPMILIAGRPILEYIIDSLKNQGYTDLIIVIGHLGNIIQDYFGDGSKISPITGKSFGVKIEYVVEQEPLGTAGALYFLKDKLTEDFLLINGDIIFDVDIKRFYDVHKKKNGLATLFTHPNSHPYDSGIIVADKDGLVNNWLHKEDKRLWYQNRVNAGIHMISKNIFDPSIGLFQELKKVDLDRDVLKPLIASGRLYVYDSPEYVKDMGTPERYYAVTQDIKVGKVQAKNLKNKQKAIFLDRDGTINKHVGFLTDIEQFELLPGVCEAIKRINDSGQLAIVVTNQPVIARGEVSLKELQQIHDKMETLLGEHGAYIDAVYFCPHHPDKGYSGEIEELKIECECRKPKAGMLMQAAKDFNIDLSESWMIGDSESDIIVGNNVKCKTALITLESVDYDQNLSFNCLNDAINEILK